MLNKVKFFFKYLFRFRAPEIQELHYIDYIITNKSYFLISWKSRFGYKLKIKPFYSTYYNRLGSSYTFIPEGMDFLDIEISNVWYSKKFKVELKKIVIEPNFEFNLAPNFKEWHAARIGLPKPELTSKTPSTRKIYQKLSNPVISVQNITYLKPKTHGK